MSGDIDNDPSVSYTTESDNQPGWLRPDEHRAVWAVEPLEPWPEPGVKTPVPNETGTPGTKRRGWFRYLRF